MELNPNHGVTREFHDHWHKLCAFLMFKAGQTTVDITSEDIERFLASGRTSITMRAKGDTITLSLVTHAEAQHLARKEGGLPV